MSHKSKKHFTPMVLGLVSTIIVNVICTVYCILTQYHYDILSGDGHLILVMSAGYIPAMIGMAIFLRDLICHTWKFKGNAAGNCGVILCFLCFNSLLIIPMIFGKYYA